MSSFSPLLLPLFSHYLCLHTRGGLGWGVRGGQVLRAGGGHACESRPEACVLRGQAMLWGGSSGSGGSGGGGGSWAAAETQAAELAREALRLDPDHQEVVPQ